MCNKKANASSLQVGRHVLNSVGLCGTSLGGSIVQTQKRRHQNSVNIATPLATCPQAGTAFCYLVSA